jgi:hypothetical protein
MAPVTMNASKTCTATFNLVHQTFTLGINLVKSITAAGAGNGSVMSSPAGVNCGTDCSEAYASGISLKLTATPAARSTFTGWTGDPARSDGSVTMNVSKTCTATFNLTVENFSLQWQRRELGKKYNEHEKTVEQLRNDRRFSGSLSTTTCGRIRADCCFLG